MNTAVKTNMLILLAALFIAGCSSSPAPQNDPYNKADSQRSRAHQTQDELSSETTKK